MAVIKFADNVSVEYIPHKWEGLVDEELHRWGSSLGHAVVEFTHNLKTPYKTRSQGVVDTNLKGRNGAPNFVIRRDSVNPIEGYDIILRRDIVPHPLGPFEEVYIPLSDSTAQRVFFNKFIYNKNTFNGYEAIIKPVGAKIIKEAEDDVTAFCPELGVDGKYFQNGFYLTTITGGVFQEDDSVVYTDRGLVLLIHDWNLHYDKSENKLVDCLERQKLNVDVGDGAWHLITQNEDRSPNWGFDYVLGLVLDFLKEQKQK